MATDKEAACLGKFKFESPELARQVRDRQKKNSGHASNVYKCAECGGWHIGHHRKMPKRRFREED